ncbi:hypothetical protein METBIDRAFT_35158 [Metschnikowia bicuspidata var. bicuspidata NRRL YB-4993]|uniref:Dynamin-type G domain-containing protein n=1 Tax=Metschnikowia bicuspidata var. bicuspidata NRRL YB-4993 TaxID=869754 RepID=A0A1A0HGR7_9ASCO|nr:hypothetical protein METBIDRAFT_35158 [Metschnikowia bicuspidata var. bicuspidata NRRL YB-4993]OBA23369.1 hypothetical protein METBIDRAFT_35158 [Metschnikowia bicuspidata var. bicuspidata NRRL YB-4993]
MSKARKLGLEQPAFDQDSDNDDIQTVVPHDEPSYMMYMPQEGSLISDSTTLFEGAQGLSSQMNHHPRPRHPSMSSTAFNASLKQMHFNSNRVALDRAINHTIDILSSLTEENRERHVFFPTENSDTENLLLNSPRAHLALVRSNTDLETKTLAKAPVDNACSIDGLSVEPADFKVLKLNLKMGHSLNVLTHMDKKSISSLLEQKLVQQVRYLHNLKDRVDDTSSKVFVTGDLNAGKSTFCNALLRRKVLPEDQQPCTSIFCEVIDAKTENKSVEEVHAIPIGITYDKRNESTYIKHSIDNLEELVYECDKYSLLKVYVLDYRSAEQSLLGNGVIDIKLIDAPGLNMDSYQTTQVFSRQEEIDLVVFVVSAENHFTLSAKEFIAAAAAEKRYVFIVVNRFDNIKDKEKCMNKILDQVKSLSPDTYKNAKDFVHFVSSTSVPGGGGGGPGDDPDNEPSFADPNFDNLEASLRKFILDKRSISKLLPAKNYLMNLLSDLKILSEINQNIYLNERERMVEVLKLTIGPKYETMVQECLLGNDKINRLVEKTCSEAYDNTRREILQTVDNFGSSQIVPYLGLQYVYEYARDTQRKMTDTIVSSVHMSEASAKTLTGNAVKDIIDFGKQTLGDEFLTDKVFKPDLMFTRKRDTIKRSLDNLIEISDFFDPSFESIMMWLGIPEAFVQSTRDHICHLSPDVLIGTIPRSVSSLRQTLPTQLTLHTLYSLTKLLTTGALMRKAYNFSAMLKPSVIKHAVVPVILGVGGFAIFYLINDIPNAFPRKQARKLRKQVLEIDYAHINADRISRECRLVLNFPARQVMNNFQTSIDKRNGEKEKLESDIKNAEICSGFFKTLLEQIGHQKSRVDEIDLESVYTVD